MIRMSTGTHLTWQYWDVQYRQGGGGVGEVGGGGAILS